MKITFLTAVLLWIWLTKRVNTSVLDSSKIGVTTSCYPHHIQISLLRESFPGINMSNLHLRSRRCNPSMNSTHVTFKAPLYGCKTQLLKTKKHFVFKNVVRGIRPSIAAECAYPNQNSINSSHSPKEKGKNRDTRLKMVAQLNMYKDSNFSLPFTPGSTLYFGPSTSHELFFDLQINFEASDVRVCIFVESCALYVRNDVSSKSEVKLDMIENGMENRMTTRLLFTSDRRTTFKFNTSFLMASMNIVNTTLRAFCAVSGYHENITRMGTKDENKTCNGDSNLSGNRSDQYHGNVSGCQESTNGNSTRRKKRYCICRQVIKTPLTNSTLNTTKATCNKSCVNGSTQTSNVTSQSSHSSTRKIRTKRTAIDERVVVVDENNHEPASSDGTRLDNTEQTIKQRNITDRQDATPGDVSSLGYFNDTHNCTCYDIDDAIKQCASQDWNEEPVSLLIERAWVIKSSVPKHEAQWINKDDILHVEQNITNGINATLIHGFESTKEKSPSPVVIMVCLYLSLVFVLVPVLSVYLCDERKQRKRRRNKRRGIDARGSSDTRLLLTRDCSVA